MFCLITAAFFIVDDGEAFSQGLGQIDNHIFHCFKQSPALGN